MTWKIHLKGMMLAADTCMLLISYCKQMMIDFRVLDRAKVLEIVILHSKSNSFQNMHFTKE